MWPEVPCQAPRGHPVEYLVNLFLLDYLTLAYFEITILISDTPLPCLPQLPTTGRSWREIMHIQVRQCGSKIQGQVLGEYRPQWQLFGGLDLQLECINVYYNKASSHKYVPRAILMDLEPGTMDSVSDLGLSGISSGLTTLFLVRVGPSNSWAKGYSMKGAELVNCLGHGAEWV
ncbi:hypothetical protein QTO34_017031 [Cnephaeus nilssonii]|uniref:Tubulin/FtsZ GTPase domain-containing protein n=1 Tax=Cnephaeus nilssonii TaxID=3371016 RepID=A0AA40I132_CNENI|nr:hypothetical protein QTO34_017031 [Eptesicus nilssonii]